MGEVLDVPMGINYQSAVQLARKLYGANVTVVRARERSGGRAVRWALLKPVADVPAGAVALGSGGSLEEMMRDAARRLERAGKAIEAGQKAAEVQDAGPVDGGKLDGG